VFRVAIATVTLAGAVYAADKVTAPESPDLGSTINAQQVKEGTLVAPRQPTSEHQKEAFSVEQMLELAERYSVEMKTALEHAENLRVTAYKARDLIRMTCIDDKLSQMNTVFKLAEPRLGSIREAQSDLLVMRQRFSILQQARERIAVLASELEQCSGDNLFAIPTGRIPQETQHETENVYDPTRPPAPGNDVSRPPEASPYR
jgi:hypothetical protein